MIRGYICNNEAEYWAKCNLIQTHLSRTNQEGHKVWPNYTSNAYAGGRNVVDLWTVDDKPFIPAPKQVEFENDMKTIPIIFQNYPDSIIKIFDL